jgi:2-polyprenyl-6-methoxyphenol hydroxylase-like FAD-dependent oxidoreductase
MSAADEAVLDVHDTACCVVGGGPGGLMLALLLARRGVPVTLLEAHHDFDRQFRGDTLHPAILEILDQIGLADRLHELPHVKWYGPTVFTEDGPFQLIDFRRVRTKFPYILVMPQERFLDFLADEARKYPHLRLLTGANVQRLVEENGVVSGVRYRGDDGWHEVRAPLTVGADGRFSRVRHLAGLNPVPLSGPMELLWFRLPHLPGDARQFGTMEAVCATRPFMVMKGEAGGDPDAVVAFAHVSPRKFALVAFHRIDHWQVGYIMVAGHYAPIRAAGLEAFRKSITDLEPRFAPHVEQLRDWHQLAPLSVAFSRCPRWSRPGLLLIGDAAHTMTPAAGAGIKYAVEDAVVAANLLAEPLRAGRVRLADLEGVRRRRIWPTRFIQFSGGLAQKFFWGRILRGRTRFLVPRWVRFLLQLPLVRGLPARAFAFGLWKVRLEKP